MQNLSDIPAKKFNEVWTSKRIAEDASAKLTESAKKLSLECGLKRHTNGDKSPLQRLLEIQQQVDNEIQILKNAAICMFHQHYNNHTVKLVKKDSKEYIILLGDDYLGELYKCGYTDDEWSIRSKELISFLHFNSMNEVQEFFKLNTKNNEKGEPN